MIGLIDTNSNPDLIAYPIPGNDDATKSIHLISRLLADSIIEGRKKFLSYLSESGVALKAEKESLQDVAVAGEHEEIIEATEPAGEEVKPTKKGHVKPTVDDESGSRKRV